MKGSERQKASHVWRRDDLDWYVEPMRVTTQLCAVERFNGSILDPCCGQGNIVTALLEAGHEARGADLVDRTSGASWFIGESDYLNSSAQAVFVNCVMNPPFFRAKGLEAFIRKALAEFPGKVCVFADVKFLAGSGRANGLFADHPPHRVWIISPRPSCPPGEALRAGIKDSGGTADWCWLVWDNTSPVIGAALGWLGAQVPA